MTENISAKIVKFKEKITESQRNYALYEIEPLNYGDHSYSKLKIEYRSESDLEEFVENKSIKIEVGEDMAKGEGDVLVISGGAWSSDRTTWQKFKDTTQETTTKIGDASSKAVKKAGEGLEKAGKNLEKSADQDKWPRWVLPVGIFIGILALIGIIVWIFKSKKT